MTNETRTPSPHICPSCKASFTDDGEFAEHMGGQCIPSPAVGPIDETAYPNLTDEQHPVVDVPPLTDYDGIMQPVDPADFDRARGLVEETAIVAYLRRSAGSASEALRIMAQAKTARQADRDDYPAMGATGYAWPKPEETREWQAADLIEQLLVERADAVQAGEKIGRAKGKTFARKVSQRHAKHGARL